MERCKKCKAVVSNMRRHLDRNRCERVIERREAQRGMPKHQRPKPETRGTRNGQVISKTTKK